jgi:hypothetical protein
MSETMKPRIAIDLDEIERQLAQAHAVPSQPVSGSRGDPLAELARIVGQDDPFQSILDERRPDPAQSRQAAFDDFFQSQAAPHASGAAPTPDARPSTGFERFEPVAYASGGADAYQQPQVDAYEQPQDEYGRDYYGDGQPVDQAEYEEDMRPLAPRKSRKGLMAVSAIAAAAVIGGGAAWYAGGSSAMVSGEAPLITASSEPTKVQPENPGGLEVPNQNKQIYERAAQSTETKIVDREEQPIDVKEATRMAAAGAPAVTGTTGTTGSGPVTALPSMDLGEPRKVRTVTIRPDSAAPAAAPAAAGQQERRPMQIPATPMVMPNPAQPAPVQTASAAPVAAPRQAAPAPAATPAPAPVQAQAPQAAPATPQRTAAVQPAAPAAAEAEAPTGGFAVQLGVRSSQADAQAAYKSFQQKYSELGRHAPIIRKAEVNGATLYRVRVGPMSRDEASTLCSTLQGQGGQCFVAKN